MTPHWVVLPLLLAAASAQLYNNGYINPLFLERPLAPLAPRAPGRGGRLYDPWAADLRDNGLYLSGGALRDRGLPFDSRFDDRRYPSRYDELRRYQNELAIRRYPSTYDDLRRYPSTYDDLRRYPNTYDDFQRYPSRYDELRRYLARADDYRRLPVDYRQFPDLPVGLATTARPEDRGQGAERGLLSTAAPDLAVTVQPNGSA